MKSHSPFVSLLAAVPLALLAACSSPAKPADVGVDVVLVDAGVDVDGPAGDLAGDLAAGDSGPVSAIRLPQAIGGALWANPAVYAEIPLHIAVEGAPASVVVDLSGVETAAVDLGFGRWLATVAIGGLGAGVHPLVVRAGSAQLAAELRIGSAGLQLTHFDVDGAAGTPRLHRLGERLFLSWTDRSEGPATLWLHELDGAGRWVGERVALAQSHVDTLYGRVALGPNKIGVIFQRSGTPYSTFFAISDYQGQQLLAPQPLDPAGFGGSFGGDVVYEDGAFVAAWRVHKGSDSEVRWLRADAATLQLTGPVVVASSGDDDPHGGFDPFVFIRVGAIGPRSIVTFVREYWHPLLELALPKSQAVVVASDGTVERHAHLGAPTDMLFHHEAHVFRVDDALVLVWAAGDILAGDNPPTVFYGVASDAQGALPASIGNGTVVLAEVDDRDEPVLVSHPEHRALMAWIDHRAYTLRPANPGIELYAAPLASDLTCGTPVVFKHATLISGLGQIRAAGAGTNAILTWVDYRHGMMIPNLKPEVFFDTVWY